MFELTPQHPALLNRTSTFQLLMSQECVLRGNRVKVHVEPAVGSGRGEQVRRDANDDGALTFALLWLARWLVFTPTRRWTCCRRRRRRLFGSCSCCCLVVVVLRCEQNRGE